MELFSFFEVGGKVRDELLGLQSKDIDYVAVPESTNGKGVPVTYTDVNYLFELLEHYLKMEGFEIFLSTPECYTIRARFPKGYVNEGVTADFVLARKELGYKPGTREPIVVPGTLLDDLTRRDFTVNAIARDSSGALYDPFGGQADLKKRLLRTPIAGEITFQDDPLRLLRAIRFAVTKGFSIDNEIHDILHNFDYYEKMGVVSEERVREELYKAFKHNTHKTLYYLDKYPRLRNYIFLETNLWLKPTNEQ